MLAADLYAVARGHVSAMTQGERFEDLFITNYPRVVAIARRVLGDGSLAEDVAQEVFTAVLRRSRPLGEADAVPWLHAAAAHTALNVLRGDRRRVRREAVDARRQDFPGTAARESDPQRRLESQETRAEVRSALRKLSRKHAAVLALRYGGLSYAEVAAALDIGINQVGTLLARAEAAFKKEISRVSPG